MLKKPHTGPERPRKGCCSRGGGSLHPRWVQKRHSGERQSKIWASEEKAVLKHASHSTTAISSHLFNLGSPPLPTFKYIYLAKCIYKYIFIYMVKTPNFLFFALPLLPQMRYRNSAKMLSTNVQQERHQQDD